MIDQFRANLMVNELLMKECDDEQGDFLKYSIKKLLSTVILEYLAIKE